MFIFSQANASTVSISLYLISVNLTLSFSTIPGFWRAPVVLLILPLQTTSERPVRPHSLHQGAQPFFICLGVRPFDCGSSHLFLCFCVFFFLQEYTDFCFSQT